MRECENVRMWVAFLTNFLTSFHFPLYGVSWDESLRRRGVRREGLIILISRRDRRPLYAFSWENSYREKTRLPVYLPE